MRAANGPTLLSAGHRLRWKVSCICDRTLRTQQRAWAFSTDLSRFHS
jgi:hypothetical protein